MSRRGSALWREWESGSGPAVALLRALVLFLGLLFLGLTGIMPLPWPQQALLATLTAGVAVWLDRVSSSYLVTLTLMLLSVYTTFRYAFWRVMSTAGFVRAQDLRQHRVQLVLMALLLLSECYAFMALLLGYMQMLWPLRRTPVPLPDDTAEWPAVDVLIPTLNEPLDVVRFTALAAANMDWPADRLNVYILDDGHRSDFRQFAEEAGIGYMTRDDSRFAKAGNLNAALGRVDSPFVVVFDADHVPTRSFLQVAMGWFLRDDRLGILQTPQHFYSPNPFERNLRQFRTIPNEDELFFGLVEDGNDFWNATYFCGSCAVLRRSALDEAGGMATETVTEDAHTSMRMQRLGWNSAYINIPQAAGLATESLSEHVRQRIRWARGMVQILRVENPLFASGLNAAQRLCYFNAMSRFLYALPRLVFLSAPLMYLVFGYSVFAGGWAAVLAYATPYLVLSSVTRSRIQGAHRHSFWTEIYETVLAPHLLIPTLLALVSPWQGRSHSTRKGSVVDTQFFDGRVAMPTLLLLSFNWVALCCAVPRMEQFPVWHVPAWAAFVNIPATLYDPTHPLAILVNAAWTIFNLILLGVASAVAWESRQRRKTVRVDTEVPSEIVLTDSSIVRGLTTDLSSGGLRVTLEYSAFVAPGDTVRVILPVLDDTVILPATVIAVDGRVVRAKFEELTLEEIESLTLLLYARADRWLGWDEEREPDHPIRSLVHVLRIALRGLVQTVLGGSSRNFQPPRRGLMASAIPLVTLALLAGLGEGTAQGQSSLPSAFTHPPAATPSAGSFHRDIALIEPSSGSLGGTSPRPDDASGPLIVPFSLPQNELVKSAALHLRYRLPQPAGSGDRIVVTINGSDIATFPALAQPPQTLPGSKVAGALASPPDHSGLYSADLTLAPELLVRSNQLSIRVVSSETCPVKVPQLRLDPSSSIELTGSLVPLQDELGLLPIPFYQPGLTGHPVVPIVFLSQPDSPALQAAAILASWFGVLADTHPLRFAVSLSAIPPGDAIVIAEHTADLPPALNLGAVSGPTLAMRTNPADPYGKLLVITGATPADLVRAARALASSRTVLQGAEVTLGAAARPPARALDDSPRWLSTNPDADPSFEDAAETANLTGDGSQPAVIQLRLPPDLSFSDEADSQGRRTLPLHLDYSYNGQLLAPGSLLQVWANGVLVTSLPLPPSGSTRTGARDAVVPIPVSTLRPFLNSFVLRWVFHARSGAACAGTSAASGPGFSGTILKDSYLDIRGTPHWTSLPNLQLFANAGFPFTRHADLSGTAVLLPPQPSPAEDELLLALMGHFGAQTGYPALGVTVVSPQELARSAGKDLLVLGTMQDQPAPASLLRTIPVGFSTAALEVRPPQNALSRLTGKLATAVQNHWSLPGLLRPASSTASLPPALPDSLLESVEWPHGSSHSAVLMLARNDAAVPGLVSAFLQHAESADVAQNVAILHGGAFSSYSFAVPTYMLGRTTPLTTVTRVLGRLSWLIALLSLLFCFLIASLLRTLLRREARVRLQGGNA
jgi:cellulose synthase (UDP-forming)